MKKILLLVLMFSIFTTYTAFGDFQIKTTIPKNRQESYKLEINRVYKKFKDNLAKLPIEKQVSNVRDIVLNTSNLLTKKQSEKRIFVLSYLKYLLNEDLDYLNVKLLEYIKNEQNKPIQCSSGYELVNGKCQIIATSRNTTGATLMLPESNISTTLFLAGSKDQKILSFRVKALYDNIRLRDLVFTGSGLENLNNFRLLTPSGAKVGSTSYTSNSVRFSNMDLKDIIPRDTTATFNILADINTNTNGKTFNIVLNKTGSTIISSNGKVISFNPDSTDVRSNTYTISNNSSNASKVSNDSKNITTSALKFKVSASGSNGITLAGATFNNTFSGYDTRNARIAVYKNSATSSNLLGATATGIVTGRVTFTKNNLIDNGYTNTYVVAIEGMVTNTSGNTDWVVSMTDLETTSGIHFKDYSNLGTFPITEVK